MFTVKSQVEFISDIRNIHENLKNIRLSAIRVDRSQKSITYDFICDKMVDEILREKICEEAEKITSPAFKSVGVTVKKIACDSQLICMAIQKYLNENYPSIAIFLKETDLSCQVGDRQVRYNIKLTKDSIDYFSKNGVFRKINDHLSKNFCSDFSGAFEEKEAEESISLLTDEVYISELQKIEHRTIKVEDVVIVDDLHMGNLAVYIEDVVTFGNYTVCGRVTEIVEKQTKAGKPFFVIHINDNTGTLSGVYFTKKATLQKIRDITVGECIIASGTLGARDGKKSFTFGKINRCCLPKNFVKKEKFKKVAPKNYSLIFPKKSTTIKVNSVFDDNVILPDELLNNEFVVFDLETTGTDVMNNGITEIGAVRIKNGKMVEEWTTLVKADYQIDQKNFSITGITNEMIANSPKINQVLPDFMKFIEGTILVAQNAEFDMKFLKRFVTANDFEVNNKVMDTMVLARKYLPELKHHDLKTLAEKFNITFNHHRALADAYATAEIFIELLKIKAQKGD